MADDAEQKRHCAAYARAVAVLRTTRPDMSDEQMDAEGLKAVDESVFGVGFARDRSGNPILNSIPLNQNHLAAVLKWQGKEAHDREVARLLREDPSLARKLGLEQPRRV